MLPSFARYAPLGVRARLEVVAALRHLDEPVDRAETFAAWLDRHRQGPEALANFWNVFVVPALNAEVDDVAAADALFVLRTAFGGDAGAAAVGWSRVPLARIAEAAAGRAAVVRTRTSVTGLVVEGSRVRGVRCASGEEVGADAVVLALPPARLAALLGDADAHGVAGLDRFRSRAIVDVHLWFDTVDAGLTFAAIAGSPVQWVFQKRPGYLCCSLSAADAIVARPEAELVELCRAEVAAAWPRLASVRLLRGAATRDPEATFVPAPGLVRPGPRTALPNLVIAGSWTDTGWPATMESAVRSGRAAAAALAVAPDAALPELAVARG